MNHSPSHRKIVVSIGLLARNEEAHLPETLATLFRQTLFAELNQRGQRAEIWCIANACTDNTAAVAERIFHAQSDTHPDAEAILARAISIPTPGRINAWNLFVHEISSLETRYVILMNADIRLGHTTTLWNLVCALEESSFAQASVGAPVPDLALKSSLTAWERLSLATARLAREPGPRLNRQLYCLRAGMARQIRLPRDLVAGEDGFIQRMVRTHLLSQPSDASRIVAAPGASHLAKAPVTTAAIIRTQKRRLIGQAFERVLLDRYLPQAAVDQSASVADTVRRLDEENPGWLRRLVAQQVNHARHFWRLYPGVCSRRLRMWSRESFSRKLRTLPATLAETVVTIFAARLAFNFLHEGSRRAWKGRRSATPASPLAGSLDLEETIASA